MECKCCLLIEKRRELYDNFFNKIYKEMNRFEITNLDKLNAISGHIRDTLILHGEINALYANSDSLHHKHKDTDR